MLLYGGELSHERADHSVLSWRDLAFRWRIEAVMSAPATPGFWHRLDLFLARLRPHREPLSLLVDAAVVAAC